MTPRLDLVPTDDRTDAQKYYDALKTIAKGYQTADQIRRRAGQYGLEHLEELEMIYENVQQTARNAIHRKRRPGKRP